VDAERRKVDAGAADQVHGEESLRPLSWRPAQSADELLKQFRAEMFNVFNTANFSNPNTTFGTANFGRITSTSGTMRRIELGGRLIF
jgi:hypothetical protein